MSTATPDRPVLVLVNCPSAGEAGLILVAVVEAGLAASGQTWHSHSCYRWEGKVHHVVEHIVQFKTMHRHFEDLCATVRSLHSFEMPSIVEIPIGSLEPEYLAWLDRSGT